MHVIEDVCILQQMPDTSLGVGKVGTPDGGHAMLKDVRIIYTMEDVCILPTDAG
jgi:hypothetical protein